MALDDELGALDAGGISDVDRRTRAVIGAAGELRDGIGLGMEHILLRLTALVFADVLKAHGGAVVAIGDDTLVLDDEGAYLTALAVGVLSPDARHTEVAHVEGELLVIHHNSLDCLDTRI